jgi:cell division septation protein DedD
MLVGVILALAVVGTGGAFAYRTLMGPSRSGEPPIIRADAGPTKIMPSSPDNLSKVPDRLGGGDGSERIVPREETPVDVDAQNGPRVVLPALNMNTPPPTPVPASATAAPAANGVLPNNEPRRIKTFSVRGGDQTADASAVASNPAAPARPAAAPRNAATSRGPAVNANASAPLSLVPQQGSDAEPRTRVASNPPAAAGSGYMVQLSAQRNEADAMTSYKTLQGKFSSVLGARQPVIKRADLGEKGIWFRAMVGPFGAKDEANQFCSSLETAGGQCRVVQSN